MAPRRLELSKAALKNKKKRARRHAKAVESSDEVTEATPLGSGAEVTEPALGPGSGFVSKTTSPFDLLKKQIEEAKATGVSWCVCVCVCACVRACVPACFCGTVGDVYLTLHVFSVMP